MVHSKDGTEQKLHWRLGTLAICVLLTACGGNGTAPEISTGPLEPGPETTVPTPDPFFDNTLSQGADDLIAVWAPNNAPDFTTLAAVPASGRATYEGFLFGELSSEGGNINDRLIGELTMSVAFGETTAFSGNATNFLDAENAVVSGTLTLGDGAFDRAGNPASDATVTDLAMTGSLTKSDGALLDVGILLEGDFLGTTGRAIGGEAIGSVAVDGVDNDFDGGFIAEQ